jgi:hypothetical protein
MQEHMNPIDAAQQPTRGHCAADDWGYAIVSSTFGPNLPRHSSRWRPTGDGCLWLEVPQQVGGSRGARIQGPGKVA